jgi:hypothetical protein
MDVVENVPMLMANMVKVSEKIEFGVPVLFQLKKDKLLNLLKRKNTELSNQKSKNKNYENINYDIGSYFNYIICMLRQTCLSYDIYWKVGTYKIIKYENPILFSFISTLSIINDMEFICNGRILFRKN